MWIVPLLLIISLTHVAKAKSNSRVLVRPTDNTSSCGDYAPCDTLSNLLSTNTAGLSSRYSEFEFLPGEHLLSSEDGMQIISKKSKKLSWYANAGNHAVITCNGRPLALVFQKIQALTFTNLHFLKCGHKASK